MAKTVKVAREEDLRPGECKTVSADGAEVALYNVGGTFHATTNTCAHRGGPLGEGTLEGAVVVCPWHGFKFNVATGQCEGPDPALKVEAYRVSVQAGDVFVELP